MNKELANAMLAIALASAFGCGGEETPCDRSTGAVVHLAGEPTLAAGSSTTTSLIGSADDNAFSCTLTTTAALDGSKQITGSCEGVELLLSPSGDTASLVFAGNPSRIDIEKTHQDDPDYAFGCTVPILDDDYCNGSRPEVSLGC